MCFLTFYFCIPVPNKESFLYPTNEKFSEWMVMWPEVWNLVVSQLWEVRQIPGCRLGNLVSLTDHRDLFFVCDPMWALSLTTGPKEQAVRANIPSLACPFKRQKVKSKMESLLRRKVHAERHTGEIRENLAFGKFKSFIRGQRHYFANKGLYSQTYGFSSSHVWMWEFAHKQGWVP